MIIDAIHLCSKNEIGLPSVTYAELSLDHADYSHSYIIEQAVGLDVDEIVPQFYGSYQTDPFNFMHLKERDIGLKIRLNPQYAANETPSSLRDALYKLISFSRTSLVELKLMNEGVEIANINGFIKKFEAAIFSATPVIQISISCPFPFFRGPTYIDAVAALDLDYLVGSVGIDDALSTAPHGFIMEIEFTDDSIKDLIIQGRATTLEWPFNVSPHVADTWQENDLIRFSSEEDNKYIYRVRDGIQIPIGDLILPNQVWPILFPGVNQINFDFEECVVTMLQYRPHYWGV